MQPKQDGSQLTHPSETVGFENPNSLFLRQEDWWKWLRLYPNYCVENGFTVLLALCGGVFIPGKLMRNVTQCCSELAS